MNNDQWLDPNIERRRDKPRCMVHDGRGFFAKLRDYMFVPTALLGLYLSVWYLLIPGIMYVNAIDNEIDIEYYARVQAMDNRVTHEYIVECLEDNIITWGEYNRIREMTEKHPVIEKIIGPDIEGIR